MAVSKKAGSVDQVVVNSVEDAERYLAEMEEIQSEIAPKMARQVEIKKAVTAFAVSKKLDVVQIDGVYFRQINRANKLWVATDDDMPDPAPRGAKSLRAICTGLTANVKGKDIPLWNFITKRVPDPEKIDLAVSRGYVKESVISKAFLEKPQAPFLQRYVGEASDG